MICSVKIIYIQACETGFLLHFVGFNAYLITASPCFVRMPNWNIWSTIWMRMNDPLPSLYWGANNSMHDTESTLKVTVKSNFSIARRNCVRYSMYDVPANLHCVCRGTGSASENVLQLTVYIHGCSQGGSGGSDEPRFALKVLSLLN